MQEQGHVATEIEGAEQHVARGQRGTLDTVDEDSVHVGGAGRMGWEDMLGKALEP